MKHCVFVSYPSRTSYAGDQIVTALESRGVACWHAARDLASEGDYRNSIAEAIDSSSVFVLVLSRDANASKQIQWEVDFAAMRGKPLICYRIDSERASSSLSFNLDQAESINAYREPDGALERLANVVSQNLAEQSVEELTMAAVEETVPLAARQPETEDASGVFISYRRDSSGQTARLIRTELSQTQRLYRIAEGCCRSDDILDSECLTQKSLAATKICASLHRCASLHAATPGRCYFAPETLSQNRFALPTP